MRSGEIFNESDSRFGVNTPGKWEQPKKAKQAYLDALKAFKDKPQEIEALKLFAAQQGIAIQAAGN